MTRSLLALVALGILLLTGLVWAQPAVDTAANPNSVSTLEWQGPYTEGNLSLFVAADPTSTPDEDVLTLDEALAKKVVTVKETGNVNQLSATNQGKKKVFLQSGDIVKGGRQDRVLKHDTMLLPGAQSVPLDAFCVEHGRWQKRGGESAAHFGSSRNRLVTKEQKMAVQVSANQGEVWASVAKAQSDLGRNLGGSVKSSVSESSLQLSLEQGKLETLVSDTVKRLSAKLPAQEKSVGYAVAINGAVQSVDVYATPKLFQKVKDRILRSAAAEAIAKRTGKPTTPPSVKSVNELVTDAESAQARPEKQILNTQISRKETGKSVVFSASDGTYRGKATHKVYLAK